MAISAPPFPPVRPPLQNGDHLSRDEFERRYDTMPDVKKAELIEGVVYMPSPVRRRGHSRPHIVAATWIGTYAAATPEVEFGADGSIRLDLDNEPQPDVFLMLPQSAGGNAAIDTDDYVAGAPELVVEVGGSSASHDLHVKLNVYRRNGVREYVVWRVYESAVDWFVLRGTEYARIQPDEAGVFHSEVFPGLRLDAPALARGDLATVLATLRQGLDSPAHADFVARLASAGD
ncbi:MAG: Uma2 family endonuclease [Actinomycetota bacterium]